MVLSKEKTIAMFQKVNFPLVSKGKYYKISQKVNLTVVSKEKHCIFRK